MLDWILPNNAKPGNSTNKKVECLVSSFQTACIFKCVVSMKIHCYGQETNHSFNQT